MSALPNFERAGAEPHALRLQAEAVAKKAALGSWVTDYQPRTYTSAAISEAMESATAFLCAAEDLPADADRSMLLSAGIARLCDAAWFRSHRAPTEPAALSAPARLINAETALLRILGRNPRGIPSAWTYIARSLFRPPVEGALPLIVTLASLRMAAALLYTGTPLTIDAPRERLRQS